MLTVTEKKAFLLASAYGSNGAHNWNHRPRMYLYCKFKILHAKNMLLDCIK